MNRCPITYQFCQEQKYSPEGLHLLSPRLKELKNFPYSEQEQRELALQMASKISIQGIQPKLSVKLSVAHGGFEIVESGGTFILKPPHQIYEELPQNEDLTMRLAAISGIEIPLHGMVYNNDGSLTYFIKRFDRLPKGHKVGTEDFSQLMGHSRETKYDSSMEKLIPVIDQFSTFPVLEKIKLFRLTLFNFIVGNEDMHLKNFSMIRRKNKTELSPAYDLLNSSLVIQSGEEMALPIRGKKSKPSRYDLVDYYGKERLGLSENVILEVLEQIKKAYPFWQDLIDRSFLSDKMKSKYLAIIQERWNRIII